MNTSEMAGLPWLAANTHTQADLDAVQAILLKHGGEPYGEKHGSITIIKNGREFREITNKWFRAIFADSDTLSACRKELHNGGFEIEEGVVK